MFSLSCLLLSSVSADDAGSLFDWFNGTVAQCDSSEMYTQAFGNRLRPPPLLSGWTAGVSEVSRFSTMKFLACPGFDYA